MRVISNQNKVLILCITILICVFTYFLMFDEPDNLSFSKLNTEDTVQVGDTYTVILDNGQYPAERKYKWDLVKCPTNSRYNAWKYLPYTSSSNYHPGQCKFTFTAIFPGTETISFVFSESYYHNATNTFNITITTV